MKDQEAEIQKYQELARRYENLGYAIKSPEGQLILEEVKSILNQVKSLLYNVAMKDIPFPYEYTKEELQEQKQLRAQLSILNELSLRLSDEECLKLSSDAKQKCQALISGVPVNPAY